MKIFCVLKLTKDYSILMNRDSYEISKIIPFQRILKKEHGQLKTNVYSNKPDIIKLPSKYNLKCHSTLEKTKNTILLLN